MSLIGISVLVAGSMFCFCRKRQLKRKQTDRDRLSVAFKATERKAGVANGVPNIYGSSKENAEEEHYSYIEHKKEELNILYDNRAFTYSDEMFEEDDEIKESGNPLYSSSFETEQDGNRNILYESMDEVSQNIIEAEAVNPVYERFD
ncbi:uncharacterized protein LOC110065957 [Orbicella faveolata]|uniref:uncharacterized protein LOC110065957 n=1 Tax=Orbicella faveolata TaxID=48498 RepID=UPI0009E43C27|nr:uncharacterized protein LOC110065957 [Orbicella faveolata]